MEKKKLVKFVNDLNDLVGCNDQLDKVLCLCFVLFADYIDLTKLSSENLLVDHMEDKISMFIEEQLMDFPVLAPVAKELKETIASIAGHLESIFYLSQGYYKDGIHIKKGKVLPPYER